MRPRSITRHLALVLVLVAAIAPAFAGRLKRALNALEEGDYAEARKELTALAEAGDAGAQQALGEIFERGWGVDPDFTKAGEWYRSAAEQGSAEGQFAFATLVARAALPAIEKSEAWVWFRKAAEQDLVRAQRHLADAYHEGKDVPRDDGEALRWYRRCAGLEDRECQRILGRMYAEGNGVGRDDRVAVRWLRSAVDAGDGEAMLALARMHLEGRVEPPDPRAAIALLEKGNAEASTALAQLYAEGGVVKQDRVRALFFAARGASGGDDKGRTLVDTLVDGLTPQDAEQMIAAGERFYRDGNYSEAALVSKVYAHRGSRSAQFRLGRMYALGYGVPQDLVEAYKWTRLGHEYHPEQATLLLDRIRQAFSPEEIASLESVVERWQPSSWKSADEERTTRQVPGKNGVSTPRLRSKVKPNYPERARDARLESRVILRAVITSEGKVADLHVLRCSPPHSMFEESALEAVSRWGYEPAVKDGIPVEVEFTIIVEYSLR